MARPNSKFDGERGIIDLDTEKTRRVGLVIYCESEENLQNTVDHLLANKKIVKVEEDIYCYKQALVDFWITGKVVAY